MNQEQEKSQNAIQTRIRDLETGMTLARSVHSSDGCVLMNEGEKITSKDIRRLRNWKKRFVYILPDDSTSQEGHLAEAP